LPFWSHVDDLRRKGFEKRVGREHQQAWINLMGWNEFPRSIDHQGVLAMATTDEEVLLVAGLIYTARRWTWTQCKAEAEAIFLEARGQLVLEQAFLPKDGVPHIFHMLREKGIKSGILTSDNLQSTESCMRLLGLLEDLDFLITPERVRKGKPDAEMVSCACSMIGIPSSKFAVVGDSPVDMQMAKAARSLAVGLVTYHGSEKALEKDADILIHSIRDIQID
jgi:phosphoglycolate phosphatase